MSYLRLILPKLRSVIRRVRHGREELKFIRSPRDLQVYIRKCLFLIPRLSGFQNIKAKVPPSLQIEPTNFCNVRCVSCSVIRSRRDKGYMNFSLFKKIIDDAAANNIRRIHLYLHGEPMLHPQIIDMIKYIKENNIGFHLTTNGMLFDEKISNAILHSGVNSADHIIFSILGYSKKMHELTMKGVKHERVLDNISTFMKLRKMNNTNGPVIETIFYAMDENVHEKNKFGKYWQGKVDHVRMVDWISESFAKYKTESEKLLPERNRTCSNIWERLTVYWNGDVTLCCEDVDGDVIIGNLNNQNIKEVWNSPKLINIKKLHLSKEFAKIPICFRCDM